MNQPSQVVASEASIVQTDRTVSDVRHTASAPDGRAPAFDWLHPDYAAIWKMRVQRLAKLEADPVLLHAVKMHYRNDPEGAADFLNDWGVTVDPRNAASGRDIIMPFILFPRQREFMTFLRARWIESVNGMGDGILVKSRDCGASWLAMAFSTWLCLFYDNVTVGFGSAKEEKVDRSGDPDCLFYKGRKFIQYLPRVFRGNWNLKQHSAHMRLAFPETEASITGEAGDNIGVGGRKTIYFVDEAALVERPKLMDTSLSANTNCRIEMSSVRGIDNVFAERARGGKIPRFDFHYRDDPRKVDPATGEMHPEFKAKVAAMDPVVFRQEYGCDFLASIEGGVINPLWVDAAVNAAAKLGVVVSGVRRGAYDIADTGRDKNAVCLRHGIEICDTDQWSGTNSNPMTSVRHAFDVASRFKVDEMLYDGDGMGATWRDYFGLVGKERGTRYRWGMFRGSAGVLDPEMLAPGSDRTNLDYFQNYKAQSWLALRARFLETFKAVNGEKYNASAIISINPKCSNLAALCSELCQPTLKWSLTGKLMIDKTPDDVMSPNLADAVMMAFCYSRPPLAFTDELLDQL